jgi:hypothetical protein
MLKEIRGQALVWFGIVGGALTIISQVSKFITLSNWMTSATERWTMILYSFWNTISTSLGEEGVLGISTLMFLTSLAAGLAFEEHRVNANIRRFYLVTLTALFIPASFTLIGVIKDLVVFPIYEHVGYPNDPREFADTRVALGYFIALYVTILFISEGSTKSRAWAALIYASTIILFFPSIFAIAHIVCRAVGIEIYPNFKYIVFIIVLNVANSFILLLPIIVSPTNDLRKRLIYIWVGVAVMFGLSEFSKQYEKLRTAANSAAVAGQQH